LPWTDRYPHAVWRNIASLEPAIVSGTWCGRLARRPNVRLTWQVNQIVELARTADRNCEETELTHAIPI
jgi:hypothetical protein